MKRHLRIISRFFTGIFIPAYDETPKTVISGEFFGFLSSCKLGKDHQVRVFRKSAVDIARPIKRALDVDVYLYSQVNYLFSRLSST